MAYPTETYDFDPILQRLLRKEDGGVLSAKELAVRLRISERVIRDAMQDGMDGMLCDRICCAVGLHPGTLFPEWWPQDEDRQAAIDAAADAADEARAALLAETA